MSGREVDIGGEELIFKYVRTCTKLESEFLMIHAEWFNHAPPDVVLYIVKLGLNSGSYTCM